MFSLENRIDAYVDEDFNAERSAQHFFASYSEGDISKKLNEMLGIQQSIETLLRQKVRSNYGMFLLANEEIVNVDTEMMDLKQLIDKTQKLIDDVHSNRLTESGALLSSVVNTGNHNARKFGNNGGDSNNKEDDTDTSSNALPPWLSKAPEELAQCIVEQQYTKAVMIVLKTRAYFKTITKSNDNSRANQGDPQLLQHYEQASAVVDSVNVRSIHLAAAIKKSLLCLPYSQLWGNTEQNKLLKLLIALEEFSLAAEGFSVTKVNAIKKVLRSVESTTDSVSYASDLSRAFFRALREACLHFQQLFGEQHCDKPSIRSLLLCWVQQQVGVFLDTLAPHLLSGVAEIASLVVVHMRRIGTLPPSSNFSYGDVKNQVPLPSDDGNDSGMSAYYKDNIEDECEQNRSAEQMSTFSKRHNASVLNTTTESVRGALCFLRSCLEVAYCAAKATLDGEPSVNVRNNAYNVAITNLNSKDYGVSDNNSNDSCPQYQLEKQQRLSLQGQGSMCLGWLLVPEIQQLVTRYAEEFIEEAESRVRQDSWMPVVLLSTEELTALLKPPDDAPVEQNTPNGIANTDGCGDLAISQSFLWICAVINHFNEEVWLLLQAEKLSNSITGYSSGHASEDSNRERGNKEETSNLSILTNSTASFYQPLRPPTHVTAASALATPGNDNSSLSGSAEHSAPSYTRADVCEVEPTAVSCVLRLFLRFIGEVESTDISGLTKLQLSCYLNTLEAITLHLLPGLQSIVNRCFFAAAVSQQSAATTQQIFRTLNPRLTRLIRATRQQLTLQKQLSDRGNGLTGKRS